MTREVAIEGFRPEGDAEVRTLSAMVSTREAGPPRRASLPAAKARDVPWAANTLEEPDAVAPADSTVPVRDGGLSVELPPFSVTGVRVPGR